MLLRAVRVENFRGIRSATLSVDHTTVLIGENDCGRSSLMEAIALALGWNAGGDDFHFQPYHVHRPAGQAPSAQHAIRIELEFSESADGEWNGSDFETLCRALPEVLGGHRRFRLELAGGVDGSARWTFRSSDEASPQSHPELLAWLRRRMPVFWLREGILDTGVAGPGTERPADEGARRSSDTVSKHYQDLIEGTALDVGAAIESGSAAARQLLLDRAHLRKGYRTPVAELLEGLTTQRKDIRPSRAQEPLRSFGTAAQNIGILLLVGAMLRLGADRVERGMDPLTLIEDPEAHLHPMTLASIWSVLDRIGGQKIIATHSGTLLASARLSSVRRLTRTGGVVREWRVPEGALTRDELRRYAYHLRSRRAAASFARCWLLVEGETEFWLMGELARACGYDFASEGVVCVEFAQCGLGSLVKVAQHLGIKWHLLADGDQAGRNYAQSAREFAEGRALESCVTLLQDADIEHCFWRFGYAGTFRRAAYPPNSSVGAASQKHASPKSVIKRAIERHSKPSLAVLLLDAVIDRGPAGVPTPLKTAIETCVGLARG